MISKLRGRTLNVRVSMYVDDTTIFVNPVREDVCAIADLRFSVSGLYTNFAKSSIIPIQCEEIDLDHVLGGLEVPVGHFPVKYLGLPLSTGRLKRIHFQPIVDKAINKLTAWNMRNIAPTSHLTLVKSVLTS
jgi:hypothetical protein